MPLTFHPIESRLDSHLGSFLDLIQLEFPLYEQMRMSFFLKILARKEEGKGKDFHVLAAINDEGQFVGGVLLEMKPKDTVAYIWFLAILSYPFPNRKKFTYQGNGNGTAMYRALVAYIRETNPAAKVMGFEIERPDQAETKEARDQAIRRIHYYQKASDGAVGVAVDTPYLVAVDVVPYPTLMYPCIHPLDDGLSYDDAYDMVLDYLKKEKIQPDPERRLLRGEKLLDVFPAVVTPPYFK